MQKDKFIFSFNAPVVISFVTCSIIVLLFSRLTGGYSDRLLFAVYRSRITPFFFLRLFGHVLGHTGLTHLVSNMSLILAVGPMVEERWGSKRLLFMLGVTALVSAIFQLCFSPNTMLMGASGIVYMLIFLGATTGAGRGKIPVTLVFVAVLYLSQELFSGITSLLSPDHISHLTHIVGGICGAVMGLFFQVQQHQEA